MIINLYLCLVVFKVRSFWGHVCMLELEFGSLGFGGGRKREENLGSKTRRKNSTHTVLSGYKEV